MAVMPPASPEAPRTQLWQYFRDAVAMRMTLQQNLDDYAFARNGGRIVYLMDANVVRIFLNPQREVAHVAAFDFDRAAEYATGTALITAEFLFSRRLPGQNDSPAYIAPAHVLELSDILQGIISDAGQASHATSADRSAIPDAVRKALQQLVDRVTTGQLAREAAVDALRSQVPELVVDVLQGPLQEAIQLRRLYDNDLLRPLSSHPDATSEIIEPDRQQVRDWAAALWPERHKAAAAHARGSPAARAGAQRTQQRRPADADRHLRQKVERDAEVLAQLTVLNAEAQRAGEAVRYVLVTADQILFRTYAMWFWNPHRQKRGQEQFTLRLPMQYVPILNANEMPNGIEHSDLIYRTRSALDSLLAPLRSIDANYPGTLSLHLSLSMGGQKDAQSDHNLRKVLEDLFGFDPYTLNEESAAVLEQIRGDWRSGFRDAVVLNAELVRRRAQAEFRPLADLLRDARDLRAAIHDHQRHALEQVEAAHLAVNTRVQLVRMIRDMGRSAGSRPRRGPLAIRVDFPRITGSVPLNDFLDQLVTEEDRGRVLQVDRALRAELDHEALLFAACVAHRCALWSAARHYAERAQALLKRAPRDAKRGEDYAQEIAYLLASSIRFADGAGERALKEALPILDASERYYEDRGNRFGLARTLAERSSLVLSAAYRVECMPDAADNPATIPGLANVGTWLDRALAALQDARQDPTVLGDPALQVVEAQSHAGVVSIEVLHRIARRSSVRGVACSPPSELLSQARRFMSKRVAGEACPPILEAEFAMLNVYDARSAAGRAEAVRMLCQANQKICRRAATLTDLDRVECVRFMELISQMGLVAEAPTTMTEVEA